MERDTLKNLLIAAAVFFFVLAIGPRLLGPLVPPQTGKPTPGTTAGDTAAGTAPAPAETAVQTGTAGTPTTVTEPGIAPAEGEFSVVEAQEEKILFVGSGPTNGTDTKAPPSPYRMRLALSNVGATVELATLTDHADALGSDERYQLLAPIMRDDRTLYRSFAIEQINVDGIDVPLGDKRWQVAAREPVKPFAQGSERTEQGEEVAFSIDVQSSGASCLRLTRTFSLPEQSIERKRHDLYVDLTVENLSDEQHDVVVTYRGGVGIRQAGATAQGGGVRNRMPDRTVDWGIHDGTRVNGQRKRQTEIVKNAEQATLLYRPTAEAPEARLSWAATENTYFTCTIAPLNRDGTDNASYIGDVSAVDLDGDATTSDDASLRFATKTEKLAAGSALHYQAAAYLGSKDGDAFRNVEEYSRRNYYFQISQGFGYCTFTWLVELMIWLLNSLYAVVRDYGVAIIILVLVVRVLLHPITKKGQVNMVRMQARMQEVAPKIEEIKKKYANDKARLNQEMMKLNINPAGQLLTCLPMFIQFPIWIALFLSLSNNVAMRHEAPFYGLSWMHDLTAQDAMFTFPAPLVVPLLGWQIPTFNLLPLLVAVFMYLQQKLQPKPKPSPTMSAQQRQQQEMMQKMMPMFSIMMLVFFYKMPSGLNLYIMASSMFGTIEQHRIRKHIKQREAAGTLHKPDRKKKEPEDPHRRKPGRMSFFQKLQKMAEEAKSTQAKRPAKTKARR